MNRRGAILHWIMFGVLISLGIFFLASKTGFLNVEEKGKWSLDFLQNNYLEAEKKLLATNIIAKNAGVESAVQLAVHGGFLSDENVPCGKLGEVYFWNKESTYCFPDIKHNLNVLAKGQLARDLPHKEFSVVDYSGPVFFGKGPMETISTPGAQYTFENSFAVNLDYSFDEYLQLEADAQKLLDLCRNQGALAGCLRERMPAYWHYHSCAGQENIPTTTRKLDFCVESPNQAKLKGNIVQYKLALDFTPGVALPVEEFSVQPVDGKYEITFPQDLNADSYVLHYTNWQQVAGKSGTAEDIFSPMPSTLGLFHKTISVSNPTTAECPADKTSGNTYLCVGEVTSVVYVLEDAEVLVGETYVAVATVRNGQESALARFELLG